MSNSSLTGVHIPQGGHPMLSAPLSQPTIGQAGPQTASPGYRFYFPQHTDLPLPPMAPATLQPHTYQNQYMTGNGMGITNNTQPPNMNPEPGTPNGPPSYAGYQQPNNANMTPQQMYSHVANMLFGGQNQAPNSGTVYSGPGTQNNQYQYMISPDMGISNGTQPPTSGPNGY
jgi:hypothetical protein